MRSVLVAALMLLVAGCATSPPTRFYTLDPVKPAQHVAPSTPITLQVAAVHLPAMLDRQEMVRETAPDQLHVSDRNRWGAPLGGMIGRVLEQDLLARLPGATIVPAGTLPRAHTRVLVIDVLRFGSGPSGRVRFEGSWSVFAGQSTHPSLSRRVQLSTRAPVGSFAAQAAAMSRLLGQLCDRIVQSLHAAPAPDSPSQHTTQNHP